VRALHTGAENTNWHVCIKDIKINCRVHAVNLVNTLPLKAAVLQMLKNEKEKLTVNTGQVMFSGEIYYY